MARFNEILVGRYNRFLQKFLSMKGGPPAPQLASEMMATWSLFHGRENRYLEGWETFWITTLVGAVAAQNSAVRLRNPTTANIIAVLERVSFWESVADQATGLAIRHGVQATDFGTSVSLFNTRMDPRGRPSSALIMSKANNVAAGGNNPAQFPLPVTTLADLILTDVQEVVLAPGDAIDFITGAVNTLLFVNLLWRERFLEDSERA